MTLPDDVLTRVAAMLLPLMGDTLPANGDDLLRSLPRLAYAMQRRRTVKPGEVASALTVIPRAEVVPAILSEQHLSLAGKAAILETGEDVRFTNQHLQDYFLAVYMMGEIAAGRLRAADIWKQSAPDGSMVRTHWEEATILLAGLYSDDCTPVLEWLKDANPELAADCIVKSGAAVPPATLNALHSAWLPRLIDPKRERDPRARTALGRALSTAGLDNRPGVCDFEWGADYWCRVPAGEFTRGSGEDPDNPNRIETISYDYWIAKYPVTWGQFTFFLDAADGYMEDRWWQDLHPDGLKLRGKNALQQWKIANHPAETVNWYEAMAFCCWLNARPSVLPAPLGEGGNSEDYLLRLPTEQEWEKAARGTDGRIYLYGNIFDKAKGNVYETGIRQTSAVGIFPHGASPYGALDMSGNVWEWCLNEYQTGNLDVGSSDRKALRGGSWCDDQDRAHTAYRVSNRPLNRHSYVGFRLVVGVRRPSLRA